MTYSDVDTQRQAETRGDAAPHVPARDKAAAVKWFAEQVARAQKIGRFIAFAQLTPALAEVLIERHMPAGTNRRLRPSKVTKLAHAIRAGQWDSNTHQGIAFAVDGTVNDGQHRINAVRKAGVAVEIAMTFGQPRATFEVIDQDITPRSAGDLVEMASHVIGSPTIAAAAARLVLVRQTLEEMRERGSVKDAFEAVSRGDLLAFVRANEAMLHEAAKDGSIVAHNIRAKVSLSNVAAAFFLIRQAGAKTRSIEEFREALAHGTNLDRGSPILACREGLKAKSFMHRMRGNAGRLIEAGAVVVAWNKWRARQNVRGIAALHLPDPWAFPEVNA